jgi:MFS family permease
MQVLAPDLLELSRQLSPSVSGLFALVGLVFWLYGAASHRFWLAICITLTGGVIGVAWSRETGVQPLVAGLLLALSAGLLSLALARVGLFFAGGFAGMMLARMFSPSAGDFVAFLLGGLIGVVFYQLWMIVVSSIIGTVLFSYGLVSLLDRLGRLDSVTWAANNAPLINWGLIGMVIVGVLVQVIFERRRAKAGKKKDEKKAEPPPVPVAAPAPAPQPPPPPPAPPPLPWWHPSQIKSWLKKAG